MPSIRGIAVQPDTELLARVERLVAALAASARVDPPHDAIELDVTQIGPGYGLPSEESKIAGGLLASAEGILVDPVYTAKGLAGLIALVRSGVLDGQRVIFWHGGGLPALFEPSLGR